MPTSRAVPVVSRFRYAAAGLLLVACLAGCVSMPSGGAVRSYSITQGPGAQSQRYLQIIPEPPETGGSPTDIVRGFLTASASFTDRQRTAREYLTTQASRGWNPTWSAMVFDDAGPDVGMARFPPHSKRDQATTATVTVTGTVAASLSVSGTYAVPSAASTNEGQSFTFDLVKVGDQWRISGEPKVLLLTSVEFSADYQLRNLYFFDPTRRYLVPDPAYVPLQTIPSDLMNGLVKDLITQPNDWLARGATTTAFPPGTKLMSDVMLDGGTAAVNLGGAIVGASPQVLERVSSQLLSTLSGSTQGQPLVQSIELFLDGKPWIPSKNAQGNPVQHNSAYSVPTGASGQFYNLDARGQLWRRTGADGAVGAPSKVARVGTGYSVIAVSRDGRYLAALRNGIIYTGPVGGPLMRRSGTGYTTMSWDPSDDLWTAGSDGIVVLDANVGPRSAGAPVQVQVQGFRGNPVPGPFTALSVAPDGVRVAVIIGQSELSFGAIVAQPPTRGGQPSQVKIWLSPFSVSGTNASFQSVTWYGPNNVITLAGSASAPVPAEYSVNGGAATKITNQDGIVSIAASYGSALIAETMNGNLLSDASTSGSWAKIDTGLAPAYPG